MASPVYLPGFALIGNYSTQGDSALAPVAFAALIPTQTIVLDDETYIVPNTAVFVAWSITNIVQVVITGNNGIDPPVNSGPLNTTGLSSGIFEITNGFTHDITLTFQAYSSVSPPVVITQLLVASYFAPVILNISPDPAPIGTSVTITGTNFGATQGTSTLTFNGTIATPISWSDTSITTLVPVGATTGNVVVTVDLEASNGYPFTVSPPAFEYVHTATMGGGGLTGTFASNTAGNLLVLAFINYGTSPVAYPPTITDTAGNTYNLLVQSGAATYTRNAVYGIYACLSCVAASSNTFTIPVPGDTASRTMGVEYTPGPSVALDTYENAQSIPTTITVPDATAGDLAIGVGLCVAGGWTPDPSTTARYGLTGDTLWQDAIVPSSGTYSQLTTVSGGVGSSAFLVLIKD
jgi:hypothetical protein